MSDDPFATLNEAAGNSDSADPLATLRESAYGPSVPTKNVPRGTLSAGERFQQGAGDVLYGTGQLAEHALETPLNWMRTGMRKWLGAVGADDKSGFWNPENFEDVKAQDFDNIVSTRENDYQQARANAGQTGIDWWRIAGEAASQAPMGFAGAGETAGARIGLSAAQGALSNVVQPQNLPNGFSWYQKVKDALSGGTMGGGIAGTAELVTPMLGAGVKAFRNRFGNQAGATGNANKMVNDALRGAGIDPSTVDMNWLSGMQKEVQDSLNSGTEPSLIGIANRAKAETLPIPVNLTKGQAMRDASIFSQEQNMRGIVGVGEPITQRLTEQNTAFLANLDALGAKDAPSTVTTGKDFAGKIQGFWDNLENQNDQAYAAVRNSKGQSAAMDQFTGVQNVRDALDTPETSYLYSHLPTSIQKTLDDLEGGINEPPKMELNVARWQQLDKTWSKMQRGATDGTQAEAIGRMREIMSNAPIQDSLGAESMQAYQQAKQGYAQMMSMTNKNLLKGRPNPNFQPLVKSVVIDGKPPETLFDTHFINPAASIAKKNQEFMALIDPEAPKTIQKTLMGAIKQDATKGRADGAVSEAVLNNWANEPGARETLNTLLPKPAAATFKNLADTVTNAKVPPVAATVNTSNTGSAVVNAVSSALKTSATAQVLKRIPGVQRASEIVGPGMEAAARERAVQGALKPGVSIASMANNAGTRKFLGRMIVPGVIAAAKSSDSNKKVSEDNANGGNQ